MQRDNTNIQYEISTFVKKAYKDYLENVKNPNSTLQSKIEKYLKFYQYIVRKFFTRNSKNNKDTNGLMLYHTLGGGKTLSSLVIILGLICDSNLNVISKRKIILITPHSVVPEFKDNLKSLFLSIGKTDTQAVDEIFKQLTFISFDAYNSFSQFMTKTKRLGELQSSFENSIIVVDEAHNFFKSIIRTQGGDSASNAKKIYSIIQNTKQKDILFMTGTPCSKTPFELMPCMNMLSGTELIPENYKLFEELFIDFTEGLNKPKIKNAEILMNRLFGLVSYVPEIIGDNVPKKLPIQIIKSEMSESQYKYYLIERKDEILQKKRITKRKANEFGLIKSSSGTYNVKSRQASIYYDLSRSHKDISKKENIVGGLINDIIVGGDDVDDKAKNDNNDNSYNIDNFDKEHSPKVDKILEIAEKTPGKVLIYSQFVDNNGLWVVEKFLQKMGYSRLDTNTNINNADNNSISKKYIIFSGEISQKLREFYKSEFNSKKNIDGNYIKYILVSKTGAEGLTLKCVRQVHVLEPYWDMTRINQIIGRAIRIGSHDDLPLEDRTVQPYIHIAAPNKKIQKTFKFSKDLSDAVVEGDIVKEEVVELKSIDEQLYDLAQNAEQLNIQFRNILKKVSIECEISEKTDYECYKCLPNNKTLFTESIESDIDNSLTLGNPCTSENITYTNTKDIFMLDNKEYIFVKNDKSLYGYKFYVKNENNDYMEISDKEPIIIKLVRCVQNL